MLPVVASATTITYTGGVQTYTVPSTGYYRMVAYGAQGGGTFESAGGLGAEIGGDFALTAGAVLDISVGGAGNFFTDPSSGLSGGGGGGGGTFVVLAGAPLVVAGGGGGGGNFLTAGGLPGVVGGNGSNGMPGACTSGGAGGIAGGGGGGSLHTGGACPDEGGGGGGFLGAGQNAAGKGGGAFPGLAGGAGSPGGISIFQGGDGGYGGGGGGGSGSGGGGGGYSGGGAGWGAGGGGSFDAAINNVDRILLGGVNSGDGSVAIDPTTLPITTTPEPRSSVLLGCGVLAIAVFRRRAVRLPMPRQYL
ncbi:MAG TPA: hypothetical protein VGS58_00880 [Candidatus Sulfopaludibacter sp.]|nr:hypothetical protein [Candidatus Sulfopaludibacter sp.]